jgi:twinkle protein
MQINGFEIDQYNIHGLKEGATTSTCPQCSHDRKKSHEKCMSVNWDNGLGYCHHCGETTQLHTYKSKESVKSYFIPTEKPKSEVSKKVLDYFRNTRGISESTLNFLRITSGKEWMPKAKKEIEVIEFNYYLHGKLVNTKFRGANKDFKFIKEARLLPYNVDRIIGQSDCVIVEGEVDCASFVEAGVYNTISVPNGFTLPRKDGTSTIVLDFMEDFFAVFDKMDRIIIAVDNDTAGDEGKKELIRRLGAEKCYTVNFLDCKDANEFLLKYGKEKLKEVVTEAKPLPIKNVLSINDTWDKLNDFWRNGAQRGLTVGLREMDRACSFEMSQYTLLLSPPNSGKSDKIDDIFCRLNLTYGLKSAFCSVENDPVFHQDKWFRRLYGHRPGVKEIGSSQLEYIRKYISENYYSVVDTGDLTTTLSVFRQLYKRHGVKLFVIDPFNRIKVKGINRADVNAYTEEYHLELDKFVKETNSHLFLVLHPTKMYLEEKSTKTYQMPTAYNAKGGGEHFDMSYNMIGMVRDFENNVVRFRTLKWKYQHLGSAGVEWCEAWNVVNGRYTDVRTGYDYKLGGDHDAVWDNSNWLKLPEAKPQSLFDNISNFENDGVPKVIDLNKIDF